MKWKDAAEIALLVFLVAVTAWLAVETRGLRVRAGEQIEVSRRALQANFAPSLQAAVRAASITRDSMERLLENSTVRVPPGWRDTLRESPDAVPYEVWVRNLSDEIARNVRVVVYDAQKRNFLRFGAAEYLDAEENVRYLPHPAVLDRQQVTDSVFRLYPSPTANLERIFSYDENSYIAVFFQDKLGKLCSYKQPFTTKQQQVVYMKTRLRCNDGQ